MLKEIESMISASEKNGWELYRIANGSFSCENFSLNCDDIDRIECLLKPVFGYRMKKAHVMVSYDNWSGVYIMEMPGNNTKEAEVLIKDIYDFLIGTESDGK